MLAVIASLLLISLYIGFRFEWKFAVPVLIALAHDLLITAGTYAIFEREVTTATVAALLTILGYSLYDTVIVFDRIRENVPRMPRATFSQIANRSMSEVFTRSLATSFVVLMPVGSLLLFGGETLKDFAFALLVGVISGAYSSIFIATPVLVEWKEREPTYMRRRRLMLQEHGGHIPAFATGTLGEPAAAPARRQGDGAPRRTAAPPLNPRSVPAGAQAAACGRGRYPLVDDDPTARRRPPSRPPRRRRSAPRSRSRRDSAPRRPARQRAYAAIGDRREAEAQAKVEAPAEAQKAREALAHGDGGVGDDGNRGVALHRVPARSLLRRNRAAPSQRHSCPRRSSDSS